MTLPVVVPFATTANYPAGGSTWSGLSTKYSPAYTYYTPGQNPSAQELNYLLNSYSSATQANIQATQAIPAQNWQAAVAWALNSGPHFVAWNDSTAGTSAKRWVVCAYIGFTQMQTYMTDGVSGVFTQFGSNFGSLNPPTGLAFDSAGIGHMVSAGGGGVNTAGYAKLAVGGSWASDGSTSITACTDAKVVCVGTNVLGALGSSSAGLALLGIIGAGITVGVSGVTASAWILKSNGSLALAIPAAALASQKTYTTTTGLSWAAWTIGIGATDVPIDVAWNPGRQQWLLAVAVGGGANVAFYTSYDGISWASTGTTLTNAYKVRALGAVGNMWVAQGYNSTATQTQVQYSFDGVTWYGTQTYITNGTTFFGQIASNDSQLCQSVNLAPLTTGNQTVQFSYLAGQPAATLT